jgi:hypothetical protein
LPSASTLAGCGSLLNGMIQTCIAFLSPNLHFWRVWILSNPTLIELMWFSFGFPHRAWKGPQIAPALQTFSSSPSWLSSWPVSPWYQTSCLTSTSTPFFAVDLGSGGYLNFWFSGIIILSLVEAFLPQKQRL